MKRNNRDLLVLSKDNSFSSEDLEQEVDLLHKLLYVVEGVESFCTTHEVIDINRYKIIQKPHLIEHVVFRREALKPFVFICNKN
jgi:hypothetical protein